MKFCASLAFTDPTHYLELARVADECGWSMLCLSDHVVHPRTIGTAYPYNENGERPWQADDPWPDAWVAISAMGAVTRQLEFVTGVYVVPMRHPFHLAKALGTASIMTGGRVSLGMGLGWMRDEFELLREDFDTRASRADEMIEVMRRLWAGEMVEHRGRHFEFGPLNMRPPVPHEIPIVVGGMTPAAFRRIGRYGDGWMPHAISTEEARAGIARIHEQLREHDRPDAALTNIVPLTDALDADGFRRAEDVGVTHALTQPWRIYGGAADSLKDKTDALRRFADEVIAKAV